MNERRMIQVTGLLAAVLLVLALPLWAAETTNISGTILALDKEAGTLVVGEVGPWRVKEGATEITPRTIAVTAGTEFKQVKRGEGPGPAGWVGEFVEVAIAPWSSKKGDFVTVQVRHEGPRLTALKVVVSTVVAP